MISSQGLIGSGTGTLACYAGGSCTNFSSVTTDVYCTDFSVAVDYSSGERYTTYTLLLGRKFIIAFTSSHPWLTLAIKGGGISTVTNEIDLTIRPDGLINTPPVTATLPIIYRTVNVQHVYVIRMSDEDSTDTLRCRWSTTNTSVGIGYDECGSICSPTLPTFALYPNNCTLVFNITAALSYYAVALQIEDFYNSTTTTPMSSVPIQFLFYGITPPGGCSVAPSIIGARPNLGLILFNTVFLL
jgi:hypothetical protein